MTERWDFWDYRADLAAQAITERHSHRLWRLPKTELSIVAWPATMRDKLFVHWHYWWQANCLDCKIDASTRRTTNWRFSSIKSHLRGMKVRNIRKLTKNKYNDDKAWLALALRRLEDDKRLPQASRTLHSLERDLFAQVDPERGVAPWTVGGDFFNVPTNGPLAILAARVGKLDLAQQLTDWIFDKNMLPNGLIADGIRLTESGQERIDATFTYCQGVALGAALETALLQRNVAGVAEDDLTSDAGAENLMRIHQLVQTVEDMMTNSYGVITKGNGGGDGGLFKGILVRYLALVAWKLPGDTKETRATRRRAKRMVMASAESLWRNRLEVDGLPVFPANWTESCVLPQLTGTMAKSIGGSVHGSEMAERDLSVQLSGWKTLEAASVLADITDI